MSDRRRPGLRTISSLACGAMALAALPAAAGDPSRDLVGKAYLVETAPTGAVNVAISYDRVGYGVISPGRVLPGAGGLPTYRLETLSDQSGVSIAVVARLVGHVSATIDQWQITAALPVQTISSDSNVSFACPGNADASPAVNFVYYDNERKGRPIRKVAAGFSLDRRDGRLAVQSGKPVSGCKATEDPL
ncbi:MAG: hypothetical protein P4L82_18380 [Ancalomicrobiaceae bacterium]|nr:hypothetical protein [Ancalomicrobiaceae bacterium]